MSIRKYSLQASQSLSAKKFGAFVLIRFIVIAIAFLMTGCSLQYHSNRAEQKWLYNKSQYNALFETDLSRSVTDNNGSSGFAISGTARTYLAGYLEPPEISELSGLARDPAGGSHFWAINDSGNASLSLIHI